VIDEVVGEHDAGPEPGELVVHAEFEEVERSALAQAVAERDPAPVHAQVHQPEDPLGGGPAGALGVEADARRGGEDRRPRGELPRPGLQTEPLVEQVIELLRAVPDVEGDLAGVGHPVA
jgi:hypothetical protein